MNISIANLTLHIGHIQNWIDILSAFLTPLIAILTGLIAYLQWKTNERKRKQDLFNMRYDNLYFPIFTCSVNITKIKEEKISIEEKGKKIQNEIQRFWQQYCKYKFLISNEDSEKLSQHYNYMLEIIQKYDYQKMNSENNAEEILSILALLYHIMQMEEILAKYLRIEPDTIIYKLKCRLTTFKNNIISNKQTKNSKQIENSKSDKEVVNE